MPNILIGNNFYISTSSACIVDLTPPTFAGINFLDVESRGQIRAGWSSASDATAPIRYEVYIQGVTSVGLFNTSNIISVTPNLQFDIFTLPDGSFLENGETYYVGIRAIDGVNNRDNNTVSMSVISTGVLTSIDMYETFGAFTQAPNGMFQGTIWANKNGELSTSLNSTLGTASYTVYDKNGNVVSGMSQSGITADSNSQFKITPVVSGLNEILDHYVVKVTVSIDSENRNSYIPLIEKIPSYRIIGHYDFDHNNDVVGEFWVEEEHGEHITNLSRLGNGQYDVYDADGVLVSGFSESGISPSSDGIYRTAPIPNVNPSDIHLWSAKVGAVIDGKLRTTRIAVVTGQIVHKCKGQFSINALNQLQATFWLQSEGSSPEIVKGSTLSTANYIVYDAAGNAVAGLTETGLVADSNGMFHITPVSATLLTDLTHYTVRIGINAHGLEHVALKGFSLLGT